VQRLKTRSQFQAVLAGKRIASTAHFVLHQCGLAAIRLHRTDADARLNDTETALIELPQVVFMGAMVPKRWAKRAVTRNMIKRQIYSVSSEAATALPSAAHVVRLRTGFDRVQFTSASSDALKKLVRQELFQLLSDTRARRVVAPLAAGRTA
jgi:ribonuclease P protein component